MPIIGTISHEIGHYFIANLLGYNAYLHFASITFDVGVEENIPPNRYIFILLGGVFQTILTSLLSIFILYKNKNIILKSFYYRFILIYFSLFISREVINFIIALLMGIINGGNYFGVNSDEKKISILFGLWYGVIPIFMFILALIIIIYILINYIKKNELIVFLIITFIGGSLGMYLWLGLFGQKIIP